MQKRVGPVVAILAAIATAVVVGLISMKLFTSDTGGSKAYSAGVKPPDLEQHVNQPPGFSMGGGGTK